MFTLLKNADLYAPEKMGVCDIIICGEKIVQIGKNLTCDFPDTTIIDCTDKIVTPGFIDQHVHITGGGGESGERSRAPEVLMTTIVKNGVTTVVGLLGTDGTTRSPENLLAKTKALNAEGITAFCLTGSYEYPSPTITGSVKGDIAFISEIIGVKIAIADHRSSYTTAQELTRLATQARIGGLLSGKPGVVHMHTGKDKMGLSNIFEILENTDLPIRQFRPTHCSNLVCDAIKFARMGGNIDFTSGRDAKKVAKTLADVFVQVDPARVTLSSDCGGSMPAWNDKNELIGMSVASIDTLWAAVRSLVLDCDVNLEKALPVITSNVALGLDMFPRKGAIAVGSDSDIVVLTKELNIDTVIARGQIMVQNGENIVMGYYGK